MTLQHAILLCRERRATFARPLSWRGLGEAVDLGKWFDAERTLRVAAVRENASFGSLWNPKPDELLDEWEVVTREDLARETGKELG